MGDAPRQMVMMPTMTPKMRRAEMATYRKHKKLLRDYLLHWRETNPTLGWPALAAEFGIDLATLYRWFDRLCLASGAPMLVDLLAQAQQPTDKAA